jgi:DNA-binding NarL/FixJ family response regulator
MVTFLVVDDSPTVLLALRRSILHAHPRARIVEATDMSRAMKVFEDVRPDVVLVDMVLPADEIRPRPEDAEPESAGLRLLQQMLAVRPGTPIILVTGMVATHPDIVDALSLGVAGVLRKPVRAEDLKAIIASLFPDGEMLSYFG